MTQNTVKWEGYLQLRKARQEEERRWNLNAACDALLLLGIAAGAAGLLVGAFALAGSIWRTLLQ